MPSQYHKLFELVKINHVLCDTDFIRPYIAAFGILKRFKLIFTMQFFDVKKAIIL